MRTLVNNLLANGQEVTVCGWVHTIRRQKRITFLVLRDATELVQVTHPRSNEQNSVQHVLDILTVESTITVRGVVTANPAVRLGGIEIVPTEITVHALAQSPLPLNEKAELDTRLDWRFLDLRLPRNQLIFAVQTTIEQAMREFWSQEGFIEIHSPKIMGSPSEPGAELFRLTYFGGVAFLAQSPQFYKQMAMSAGFDRVFEIGPVFRANPSFTSRHDTEFTSVDVEMAWIGSHEDVMTFEERWLQYVLGVVAEHHGSAIEEHFGVSVVVPTVPFPRVTMSQAYEILEQEGYMLPPEQGGDLDPEGERRLFAAINRATDHEFVFVTMYPRSVRPFYHMRPEGDPSVTNSFDLLWKGLEVTTRAQREHRLDQLMVQATEKGISHGSISYYLDFFRYGIPPHGGFGFGLTRMLMVLLLTFT